MGLLTRQSREELATWADDPTAGEFAAFLDDVTEDGFRKACEDRVLAQGAVLRWIAANDVRSGAYAVALQVKAEVLMHDSLDMVGGALEPDGAGGFVRKMLHKDDVPGLKLQTAVRSGLAGFWNERYRARVQVDHTGEVRIDAGLTVAMGDLLDRVVSTQPQISPPVPDAEATALPEPLALPEPAGAVEDAQWRI